MSGNEADVVVAGAGHNSLIAAAYLAEAGLDVLVLEAREVIGGNTVTEELTLPGFKHDSCSSAHVLIQSNPMMRNNELGLDRYGLRYVFTDPAVVMPLEGGESITMWRDRKRTADELGRFSRADAAAYLDLLEEWDSGLKGVHARVNGLPHELDTGSPPARRYAEMNTRTAHELVDEWFTHPRVRSFILWLAFATIQDVDRPGTGILPVAVTAGRQEFGWAMPVGGSGMLPTALARSIEAHGGRVVANAPVTEVTIEDGRASGVVTADGTRYRARRAVLSTIHAARLPEVLPEGGLPDDFVARLQGWKPGHTLFAVHLALPRVPSFAARDGWLAAAAGAFGSSDGLPAQIAAHAEGRTYVDDPWILVVNACSVDATRAPDGAATLKLLTIAPRELRGSSWDREGEVFGRALVDIVSARMDFDPDDALATLCECPLDLEHRNPHNYLGSCHGGELSPEQSGLNRPVPGYSHYRMPVPGLYQTGASTHPGGSVSGRPGRNAARVLLADLGVDPDDLMS
ncbi:MAG TPA: NAD(P)/FAD-dependent oxidoreductase [Actinomycetota bacterium]|nr:NAD(P)/FAD-dependent oxidoreductase [Actinomycetota bacterium]